MKLKFDMMQFICIDYEGKFHNLPGHSSLTPVIFVVTAMNFGALASANKNQYRTKATSSIYLEVIHDVEWKCVNFALNCDVIKAHLSLIVICSKTTQVVITNENGCEVPRKLCLLYYKYCISDV